MDDLAALCTHILTDIPSEEEWQSLRHALSEFIRTLRRSVFTDNELRKLLYYVHSLMVGVLNYINLRRSFKAIELISKVILKGRCPDEGLINDILETRDMVVTHVREVTGLMISRIEAGKHHGFWQTFCLHVQVDRINMMSRNCEEKLVEARKIIDDERKRRTYEPR